MAVASAMWPFITRVKSCFSCAVGVPMAIVRVMSVVPVRYCAPESMSSSPWGSTVELDSGDAE